jgi:hypothetical protein
VFIYHADLYGQYHDPEYKELENIREYIVELAMKHAANLKVDTVQRFNQQVAKYFESNDVNMAELYQELCVAREVSASEFERKEKGKYTQ